MVGSREPDGDAAIARVQVGDGPLEALLERVLDGDLPLGEARRLATATDVVSKLSPAYVDALTSFTERAARQGAREPALLLQDLVVSATVAAKGAPHPGDAAAQMATRAVLGYVEVAHLSLVAVPDGRVYRRALELGEQVEREARAAGDRETLSAVLHRLGTLHLDPYSVGRSTEAF